MKISLASCEFCFLSLQLWVLLRTFEITRKWSEKKLDWWSKLQFLLLSSIFFPFRHILQAFCIKLISERNVFIKHYAPTKRKKISTGLIWALKHALYNSQGQKTFFCFEIILFFSSSKDVIKVILTQMNEIFCKSPPPYIASFFAAPKLDFFSQYQCPI